MPADISFAIQLREASARFTVSSEMGRKRGYHGGVKLNFATLMELQDEEVLELVGTIREHAHDFSLMCQLAHGLGQHNYIIEGIHGGHFDDEEFATDEELETYIQLPDSFVSGQSREAAREILYEQRKRRKRLALRQQRKGGRQSNWMSSASRTKIYERDLYRCRYCGNHKDLGLDHIHPYADGGSHEPGNLVTCCRSCNSKKGARTPEEAGMTLRPEPQQ